MALLPDSSKIYLVFQQLKSSVASESGGDLWKETIHIAPEVLWVVFAFVFLILFYKPLRDLIPKIDGFEFKGMKLSFLRESLDEAVNFAKERNEKEKEEKLKESFDGIVEIAMSEKNRQWQVHVTKKDKDIALKRAIASKKLLSNARLLWVDDFPQNYNHERNLFQQFDVYCDIAQSTQSALACLNEFNYDCIISDMMREGDSVVAGIELISQLRESNNKVPVILYVGIIDKSLPTPAGAFGITNRPDQLLHLIIDALERTRQ